MLTITLTEAQKDAVNLKAEHMLIKGIPGSGKTTVLLKKIENILKSNPSAQILLITYNKTLVNYLKKYLESINVKSENLIVSTYHSWAYSVGKSILKKSFNTNFKKIEEIKAETLEKMKNRSKHRFFHSSEYKKFLFDEVSWMKSIGINDSKEYLEIKRTGRGLRLNKEDRIAAYEFYKFYNENLLIGKVIEYDDYANYLYEYIKTLKELTNYNYVLIDEAQDLSQMQLITLREVAKESICVSADLGQKIYKTDFTWKSVGIQVQGGRTKSLSSAYRSSKEIMSLANSLIINDPLLQKDNEILVHDSVMKSGQLPVLFKSENQVEEFKKACAIAKEIFMNDENCSIGILTYKNNLLDALKNSAKDLGLPTEVIKNADGNVLTPGVKILSMHGAKGLEFDYVIIVRLIDSVFPGFRKNDAEEEKEEQLNVCRRLLYVSFTRAKRQLFLTYYGTPSRLLKEIDSNLYIERS